MLILILLPEISRHYKDQHGHHNRQPVPYHLCAIVSEAAARELTSDARVEQAKQKDGREEREPRTRRYPNWMPGGGRAAWRTARSPTGEGVTSDKDSDSEEGQDGKDKESLDLAPVFEAQTVFDRRMALRLQAILAAELPVEESAQQYNAGAAAMQRTTIPRPEGTFSGWERGWDSDFTPLPSSSSSEAPDESDDEPDAAPRKPSAIKTLPGNKDRNNATNHASKTAKKMEVDDFSGFRYTRGFLAFSAFERILDNAVEAINPFCMTVAGWDHAIRVVNAYFLTDRSDAAKNRFDEFLLLFDVQRADFLDDQAAMTKWYYEGRSQTKARIWEGSSASSAHQEHSGSGRTLAEDKPEAHRCYICGLKLFSFHSLDTHYQVHHPEERHPELSRIYRNWWKTRLLASNSTVDDSEGNYRFTANTFACHHCDEPFEGLQAIDAHFFAEHREERRNMLLRLFEKKFNTMKEALFDGRPGAPVADSMVTDVANVVPAQLTASSTLVVSAKRGTKRSYCDPMKDDDNDADYEEAPAAKKRKGKHLVRDRVMSEKFPISFGDK